MIPLNNDRPVALRQYHTVSDGSNHLVLLLHSLGNFDAGNIVTLHTELSLGHIVITNGRRPAEVRQGQSSPGGQR